jgi:secreted Zn-dependent insulinase-like peptidase
MGRRNDKSFAMMQLLQGTINNEAYNYLRSKKTLGYVAAASFKSMGCVDGLGVLV